MNITQSDRLQSLSPPPHTPPTPVSVIPRDISLSHVTSEGRASWWCSLLVHGLCVWPACDCTCHWHQEIAAHDDPARGQQPISRASDQVGDPAPALTEPAFGHAPTGNRRWWTRERILAGLGDYLALHTAGPLPCSDAAWNSRKKGNPSWPPASRVLQEFGSMARAWLAAGASSRRVSLRNVDWTADEDEYLLENAGRISLKAIAKHLGRAYGAVHVRMGKTHGKKAREVQCYLSAAQVAARFNVPYHRVQEFCRTGRLPAKKRLGNWQIDVRDAEKNADLNATKRTYRTTPPDVGDYYKRYGIRRRQLPDGRLERYETAV